MKVQGSKSLTKKVGYLDDETAMLRKEKKATARENESLEKIMDKTEEDAAVKVAKFDMKVVKHIDKVSTLQQHHGNSIEKMKACIKQLENAGVSLKQQLGSDRGERSSSYKD